MGKCNGSTEEPVQLCPRGVRESFPGLEAFNLGLCRMNRSLPNRGMKEGCLMSTGTVECMKLH